MIGLSIEEICIAVHGTLKAGMDDVYIDKVSTDSRNVPPGSLFVALVGERFDGHDFIDVAVRCGARAVLVSKSITPPADVAVIRVEDTLVGLQQLAGYLRRKWAEKIVAITGSNGKTSTKDLVAAVLETELNILKTQGNFNNEIGLPLTLLELSRQHQVGVVEMGMRGLGEIALLAQIAQPNIGIITNIGETHLERLGSIENIAQAKGELLDHLDPTGVAILNGDDERLRQQAQRYHGEKIFYGFGADNHLRVLRSEITSTGKSKFTLQWQGETQEIHLNIPGQHNILNACAAIATGRYLGIAWENLKKGLATAELTSMRLQVINKAKGTIINDAYNANPASVVAALAVLQEVGVGQRRIAVLGSMFELGDREEAGHREVGAVAATFVDQLITVGELGQLIASGAIEAGLPTDRVHVMKDNPETIEYLRALLRPGDVVLVKGSRGMRLEEVVNNLETCMT